MARLLRHEPHAHGLVPDAQGWVDVADLVSALRALGPRWHDVGPSQIAALIQTSSKKRFEIHDGRIRALYGHSYSGGVRKQSERPPALLFHGTTSVAAAAILEGGLRPMSRQFAHLSNDVPSAVEVGRRRTHEVTVLVVDAHGAHEAGVAFYKGTDNVWLADHVPPEFINRHG